MSKRLLFAAAVVTLVGLAAGPGRSEDREEAKGEKVGYKVYTSYFVSNRADLKGDVSHLVFTDAAALDRVLKPAPPNLRQKREYLPRDVFDSKLVVAVIKRGNKMWTYKVEKVTADGETLYVQYTAEGKDTTATFASPLIVAAEKGKAANVVFIENSKRVGRAAVGK